MVITQDRMLIPSLPRWRYLVPHGEPYLRLLPWADLQQTLMGLSSSLRISHPRPWWDTILLVDMANVTARQWGLSESAITELWGSPYLQQSVFGLGNGGTCWGEKIQFFMPIFNLPGKNGWNTEDLAQMSAGKYGKHYWKTSASTDLDMSKHEGRSPTLPSCSSLNCLCFPECPSCKYISKGVERRRARNGLYKTRCLSPHFALFTVSGERYFRKTHYSPMMDSMGNDNHWVPHSDGGSWLGGVDSPPPQTTHWCFSLAIC